MIDRRRLTVCLIVESGTDVRLVDDLADRFNLTVVARRIPRGFPISHAPKQTSQIEVGDQSRLRFAIDVFGRLFLNPRFDLVLVQGYALAALAANLATRLRRIPGFMLVCSPVERYYRCRQANASLDKPFRSWELFGLTVLARINARLGRRYIAISQHLADVVGSHGTRAVVDVIPVYGVDTSIFAPANEPVPTIRQRIGLPLNGNIIFYSSRVAPEKDSETLLRAFRGLLSDNRLVWLLHRSGGYRQFLDAARRVGVVDRVIATDARHPLGGLADDYRASDLCVQASREEGLGFSPLESLACGVPVVATAVGGLRETVIDGVTGWTYPVGDYLALAKCMAEALDNPQEARRRALAGRRLVAERYERRKVFDQLEELLRGAV